MPSPGPKRRIWLGSHTGVGAWGGSLAEFTYSFENRLYQRIGRVGSRGHEPRWIIRIHSIDIGWVDTIRLVPLFQHGIKNSSDRVGRTAKNFVLKGS